jgi:hypothetical protein
VISSPLTRAARATGVGVGRTGVGVPVGRTGEGAGVALAGVGTSVTEPQAVTRKVATSSHMAIVEGVGCLGIRADYTRIYPLLKARLRILKNV